MNDILPMILIQVILIALNAVFACAELAIISVNDSKLNKMVSQGDQRAVRLQQLTSQPAGFLATIQIAITLSGFLGSAFAAENFSDVLVEWILSLGVNIPRATLDNAAVIVITLILSYLTLVFGELVPKRVAQRKAEQLALALSGLISGISKAFSPLVWLLTASTNGVLRLLGIDPNEQDDEVSEEEIRMMVDAGSEKGTIDRDEKEFIQNVFDFDDLTAGEICTHRTDVELLSTEESMEEWAKIIHTTPHTLYPVCEDSPDEVIGILNTRDYFRLEDKSRENIMANAVSTPYFVPENVKTDVLFQNMRKGRIAMAVVLDEYGGMVGIVTIRDLIEQLVGSLEEEDDNDPDTVGIKKTGEDTWLVCGNAELEELEETTGIPFTSNDFETLTGLVFSVLGTIPPDGKTDIQVELPMAQVHITQVSDHQLAECTLRIKQTEPLLQKAGQIINT